MEKYMKPAIEVMELQQEEVLCATSKNVGVFNDEEDMLDAGDAL